MKIDNTNISDSVKVVVGSNFFSGKRYIGIASAVPGKSFFDAEDTTKPLVDKDGNVKKSRFGKELYQNEYTDLLKSFGFEWDGISGCHIAERTDAQQLTDVQNLAAYWEQLAPSVKVREKAAKKAAPDARAALAAKLTKG